MIVGTVTDALSGEPVYKATILVGGRTTLRYMDRNFQITNLTPGAHQLNVSAPGYESEIREINLKKGKNFVEISVKGKEIPNLHHIIVFADSVNTRGIQIEIRFVNKQGIGIKHFPRVAMSMDAELFVRLGTKDNYRRGRLVYAGPVDLFWDPKASFGKNKGIIPKDRLKVGPELKGMFGILDLVLHMEQGDFKETIRDILLDF